MYNASSEYVLLQYNNLKYTLLNMYSMEFELKIYTIHTYHYSYN